MIEDRASWNAREPKEIPVQTTVVELFLHHSVGSGVRDKDADGDLGDDYMRSMQNFHMDIKGWNDIAYNHAHDPDGAEFYEGRGFGIRPGAQCRHNTGTHSLVVMGDFRRRTVTSQLIDSIARFYHSQQVAGTLPRVAVQGHRDAPLTGDCTGTTCPGDNLYRALPTINQRINELHEGSDMFIAADGRNGWARNGPVVEYWQHFLRKLDPSYDPGVGGWGDATTREFKAQLAKFSPGDPVIGPGEKLALESRLIQKMAPSPDGGLSAAQVKAIINDSQIVAP